MRQRWACNILLSTHGRDLSRLKSWVDDGDDYQTLYKMVYNDFQGESQRSVLQHISTQGQQALQEMQAVAPTAPPGVCLKVRSPPLASPFPLSRSIPPCGPCRGIDLLDLPEACSSAVSHSLMSSADALPSRCLFSRLALPEGLSHISTVLNCFLTL